MLLLDVHGLTMDSLMIAPGPESPPGAVRHEADSRTVYLQRPESVPLSLGHGPLCLGQVRQLTQLSQTSSAVICASVRDLNSGHDNQLSHVQFTTL